MTDSNRQNLHGGGDNVLERTQVLIYRSGLLNLLSSYLWFASCPQHPISTIWLPWFIASMEKKSTYSNIPATLAFRSGKYTRSFLCQNLHCICFSLPSTRLARMLPWPLGASLFSLERPFLSSKCKAISYTFLSCLTYPFSIGALGHSLKRYIPVWVYLHNFLPD